jgi:hypothetical protein
MMVGEGLLLVLGSVLVLVPAATAGKRNSSPRNVPKEGAACTEKQAPCSYACGREYAYAQDCRCRKDEDGAWRWQCVNVGSECRHSFARLRVFRKPVLYLPFESGIV